MSGGVHKVFNSNVMLVFASILIQEETTKNTIGYIFNYTSSFLLNNFNFIISKRLYHTGFKLNIVNVPTTLPHPQPLSSSLNPLRSSQCPSRTLSCVLFPNSCKTQFFSFLANALSRLSKPNQVIRSHQDSDSKFYEFSNSVSFATLRINGVNAL